MTLAWGHHRRDIPRLAKRSCILGELESSVHFPWSRLSPAQCHGDGIEEGQVSLYHRASRHVCVDELPFALRYELVADEVRERDDGH